MAEIFRKIIDSNSLYAAWHITETAEELHSAIYLKPGEEELYNTFVAESRKKQWLAYRLLIRKLLEPGDFPVEYDQIGKPYLAGTKFHISVTHTEDLAAVIMSSSGRTGIDMEKARPRIEKVKHKFVNEKEEMLFIPGKELEQLTLVWCAKEALYKLYGYRTLDFRDHIQVEVPASVGTQFNAIICLDGKTDHFSLSSEMVRDAILVYLVE